MAIKAITIDLWNTLINNEGGEKRDKLRSSALFEEFARVGATPSADEIKAAYQASWRYFDEIWKRDYRTPSTKDTIIFFMNFLKVDLDSDAIESIAKAFAESLLYVLPGLIDGVKPALDELSKKYPLVLVSDTGFSPGSVLREVLKELNIYQYFSAFSFSDETGVSKPHSKAFLTGLEGLRVSPEDCAHIGDIEATDIKGAKSLGMKAIRFEGDQEEYSDASNAGESAADFKVKTWEEACRIISYEL